MKKTYNIQIRKISWYLVLLAFPLLSVSCSDDDASPEEENTDLTEIFIERIETIHSSLVTLRDGATFGEKKGDYPEGSKDILDKEIDSLADTLAKLKEGTKKLKESEMDRIIKAALKVEADFKASIRLEDFLPNPAELLVTGHNGGYIDFGSHPEYSSFGPSGEQAFTVEFWMKLTDIEGFVFFISTFIDNDANDHEREGWCVNSHFQTLRMTYGIGFNDLFEPGFGFNTINQWVHVAVVTNEQGVDGEIQDGIPVMTKIYIDGELQLAARGRDDRLPYTSNGKSVSMVAFTGMSHFNERIGEKSSNGYMKHLHIWKSAKTQDELRTLMQNPDMVTGKEDDLVCGWQLDRTVTNDNRIIDLTGKYTARLVGDYQWIELN